MTTYGLLSTFPPTQCGLASFTAALLSHLVREGEDTAHVVRVADRPGTGKQPVAGELLAGDENSRRRAVEILDGCDVVVVQHEYGIYGGQDGEEVLALLQALTAPVIVVLHTVLAAPSPHQRSVLQAVADAADAVVVMAETPRQRLVEGYAVDPRRVRVIPHGAPQLAFREPAPAGSRPQTVLTWGLIGPGKGIEWGIQAMVHLRDLEPAPRYLVVGQTHPKVKALQGERYRTGLLDLARQLGVGDMVRFDNRYPDAVTLAALVGGADAVLLPYDSTEQVTSGVLAEAVAAGRPVVATRFPHAVELLRQGAGLLVPHRDSAAVAHALRKVLTEPACAAGMRRAAEPLRAQLRWSAVADRYRELATHLNAAEARTWQA